DAVVAEALRQVIAVGQLADLGTIGRHLRYVRPLVEHDGGHQLLDRGALPVLARRAPDARRRPDEEIAFLGIGSGEGDDAGRDLGAVRQLDLAAVETGGPGVRAAVHRRLAGDHAVLV